ncbi:Uncharacterised protein [uncultured archaeon]|nr:Uncharacterised protein [uncultured archaeon]
MAKRKNPLLLHNAEVKIDTKLGEGRFYEAHKAQVREKTGRRRLLAVKFTRRDTHYILPELSIIRQQKTWADLRKNGLPVVEFSKVDLRKSSKTRLHVFVPNLERRYGKLIPTHDSAWMYEGGLPKPTFLKQLKLSTDKKLIDELSSDLAKIHKLHYAAWVVDFWHFYKKGDTYERIILDVGELSKRKAKDTTLGGLNIQNTFVDIYHCMGREEFQFFIKQYMKHTPSRPLAEWLYNSFAEKPRGYYAENAPRRRERWREAALKEAGK